MDQITNKLVCINITGVSRGLEYGKIYNHVKTEGIYVWVVNEYGNQQRHLKSRFKNPLNCIKCIRDSKGDNITVGNIYEVLGIDRDIEMVKVRTDRGRKASFDWKYFEDFIPLENRGQLAPSPTPCASRS